MKKAAACDGVTKSEIKAATGGERGGDLSAAAVSAKPGQAGVSRSMAKR